VPELGALARLVRLPAALTVPGDSLAGAAAAGRATLGRSLAMPIASAFLYWAGMALNDYADRDLDAVERPERPIPSGEVSAPQALALATGLTVAGLGVAAAAGGVEALTVAVPLAATIWAYDLWLKPTPAGPVAMAAARGLDVLLGAGPTGVRRAAPAAATVAVHTLGLTVLSRDEVHGSRSRLVPAAALGATATAAISAGFGGPARGRTARVAAVALAAAYAANVGRAQLVAARDLSAASVRRAVGASIVGGLPLQGALAARAGAIPTALAVAGGLPLVRRLSRRVSAT
jgi:hypothetical protein